MADKSRNGGIYNGYTGAMPIHQELSGKNADSICRLCEEYFETIDHLLSDCSILTPKRYKCRHDKIGRYIHWMICLYYKVPRAHKWYKRYLQSVIESHAVNILTDDIIHTDRQSLIRSSSSGTTLAPASSYENGERSHHHAFEKYKKEPFQLQLPLLKNYGCGVIA